MDIGSLRMDRIHLMKAEIRTLLSHGWKHLRVTLCCKERDVDGGAQEIPVAAKITNPQASAELDSPNGQNYIYMAVLTEDPGRFYGASDDPRSRNRVLQRAFHRHAAILDVTTAAIHGR